MQDIEPIIDLISESIVLTTEAMEEIDIADCNDNLWLLMKARKMLLESIAIFRKVKG